MARKSAAGPKGNPGARKQPARKRSAPRMEAGTVSSSTTSTTKAGATGARASGAGFADLSKMTKLMTLEQAIELYKSNAALALEIINTTIESAARLRQKQYEGEQEAREFQRKHARSVAEARDAPSLVAAGQGAAREAMEKSMHYWGEMFALIAEIQKRLYALMEEQMQGMPGVKETRAAMAMLPDFRQMQKVVSALQGVISSGGNSVEAMQRAMGDFAKMAHGSMPGSSR